MKTQAFALLKRITSSALPVICAGVLLSGCGKEKSTPVTASPGAVAVATVSVGSAAPQTITPASSVVVSTAPAPAPMAIAGLRVASEEEEESPFLGFFKSPLLRGRLR